MKQYLACLVCFLVSASSWAGQAPNIQKIGEVSEEDGAMVARSKTATIVIGDSSAAVYRLTAELQLAAAGPGIQVVIMPTVPGDPIKAGLGLDTWNAPSRACLATRVPYGEPITAEKLSRIERAENLLQDLGFAQCRVRDHQTVARIEVAPGEIARLIELRERIVQALKAMGYAYVVADLQGFRSGSMNEVIG